MQETFESAYEKLEHIIEEIQSGNVSVDELLDKIKQAKELLRFCEGKLEKISQQVEEFLEDDK